MTAIPLISIVIPVYNAEAYFPHCMESVLNQTYENYEVVLVDDGSSDYSGEMCDKYADTYYQVRVFHQQNKGQSAARNFGVLQSKGTLVLFIDADDYVSSDYLEYLYMLMNKYSVDISCARFERCGDVKEQIKTDKSEKILSSEEALIKMCYCDEIDVTPIAKLYKKEILLKYPYPEGVIFEDMAMACKHIAEAKVIVLGNKVIYHYTIHQGSTINRRMDEKQYEVLSAADEQRNFIAINYPNIEYAAKARCIRAAVGMLGRNDILNHENARIYYKRIKDYLRPYFKDVITDMKLSAHIKIKYLIIMTGFLPSKFIWGYIRKILLRYREWYSA